MKKIYILDTNVLMYDPKALFAFDDNEVIIPLIVLDELDKHKTGNSQAAKHARMTIRLLDELRALGSIHEGVLTERGGSIKVELNHVNRVPGDLDPNRADNRLIGVALSIKEENESTGKKVTVITKDINLRVKCDALGVRAEDYTSDSVIESLDALYTGFSELCVESTYIDELYKNNSIPVKNMVTPLMPNEYVHLKSNTNNQHSALAKFDGSMLKKIKARKNIWGISPRNKEQSFALDALFDPDIKLVTITGRSGGGKTLTAALAGISQLLDEGTYNRVVLARPIMPLGKELGYLPGTLLEKLDPWMAPFYDNLDLIFSERGRNYLDGLINSGEIDIQALTYIRGRSIPKSFIIVDEAQQLTKHEAKTILTRIGEGSKLVMTGDIEQIDTPYLDSFDNALSYIVEKLKGEKLSAHITFLKGERSELATIAAEKL